MGNLRGNGEPVGGIAPAAQITVIPCDCPSRIVTLANVSSVAFLLQSECQNRGFSTLGSDFDVFDQSGRKNARFAVKLAAGPSQFAPRQCSNANFLLAFRVPGHGAGK